MPAVRVPSFFKNCTGVDEPSVVEFVGSVVPPWTMNLVVVALTCELLSLPTYTLVAPVAAVRSRNEAVTVPRDVLEGPTPNVFASASPRDGVVKDGLSSGARLCVPAGKVELVSAVAVRVRLKLPAVVSVAEAGMVRRATDVARICPVPLVCSVPPVPTTSPAVLVPVVMLANDVVPPLLPVPTAVHTFPAVQATKFVPTEASVLKYTSPGLHVAGRLAVVPKKMRRADVDLMPPC